MKDRIHRDLMCSLRKTGKRVQEANMQKHIKHARSCGRYVGEKRGTERRGVIMRKEEREKNRVSSRGSKTSRESDARQNTGEKVSGYVVYVVHVF